ncbi:MAG: alpha/beta hydrolase [Thermoanaerobaculia bacterium]
MKQVLTAVVLISILLAVPASAQKPADEWLGKPVEDQTFKSYLDFFAYDRRLPFQTQVKGSEDDQGLRRTRLSFETTRAVRVPAILTEQTGGAAGKKPAIILLHGGVGSGKEATTTWATLFARAGWSVLAIDLPEFGERGTGLLTTYSEQEKHDKLYNRPPEYLSWMTQLTKDVRRSYDFLVDERDADPRRVTLIGNSRGAMAASVAGAVEDRLAGVALIYGGHFDAFETGHLPAACPANYIGRIAPRPLFMINGKQDSDMIRDRSVEPLFEVARQPKEMIWTEGGHMFMKEEHRAALIQWLREKARR